MASNRVGWDRRETWRRLLHLRTVAIDRLQWPVFSVLPALVAMRGMFSTTEIFTYRDGIAMFWPIHRWFRRSIQLGEFPLWDPFLACGQSAVADPTRHIFFPPALLLRMIPSEVLGYNLSVGLPFPIAALGVYLLLRTWLSKPSSALGGMVFSISSVVLSTGNMPNLAWSIAIAPWVVWMTSEFLIKGAGWRFSSIAALSGLQVLAGEPVTLVATMVVAGSHGTVVHFKADGTFVRRTAAAALAMASGLGLAAVQMLPLAEAARFSTRSNYDVATASFWSFHPLRLLEMVVPFPFGDVIHLPAEYAPWFGVIHEAYVPFLISNYVGIAFIAVAVLGILSSTRRRRVFWMFVAVGAMIASFGGFTPIYPALLRILPVLQSSRFPEKYTLITALALTVFVAQGWESLLANRVSRRSLVAALGTVAICAIGVLAVWFSSGAIAESVGASEEAARQLSGHLGSLAVWFTAMVIAVAFALIVMTTNEARRRTAGALLFGILVFDLLVAGAWLNPMTPVRYLGEPPWVSRTAASGARSFTGYQLILLFYIGDLKAGAKDPHSFNPSIRTPRDEGFHVGEAMFSVRIGLFPSQWGMREALTYEVPNLFPLETMWFATRFKDSDVEERSTALERVGVRTQVLRRQPLGPYEEIELIDDIEPIQVYFSDQPFDRSFVAPVFRIETDKHKAIDAIFSRDFDFQNEVLLDRAVEAVGNPGSPQEPSAAIVEDRSNRVTIEATAAVESTVVLLDSYNPGWHAYVDGEPADIVRVDGLFLGVRVPPGKHTVHLRFLPQSFVNGAIVSGVTLVVLLIVAFVSLFRGWTRTRPIDGDVDVHDATSLNGGGLA